MSTFVLVHGSWHDGSAWESVRAHLAEKGHRAFNPTIAGHGTGVDKNVNHAQCTQSIIDFILEQDLRDLVLLGHSFGGTILSQSGVGPGGLRPALCLEKVRSSKRIHSAGNQVRIHERIL